MSHKGNAEIWANSRVQELDCDKAEGLPLHIPL